MDLFCPQGKRSLESKECCSNKDSNMPTINLLQNELEGEDYLFRTCVDEL